MYASKELTVIGYSNAQLWWRIYVDRRARRKHRVRGPRAAAGDYPLATGRWPWLSCWWIVCTTAKRNHYLDLVWPSLLRHQPRADALYSCSGSELEAMTW